MAVSYFLGSKEERLATERAWRYSSRRVGLSELLAKLSGHDCRFELDGAVHKNGDVCVKLNITNDASNSRQIKVRMYANAKYYTGTAGEEIDDFCKEITVGAKESKYFYHFLIFAQLLFIAVLLIQYNIMTWAHSLHCWPFVRGIHSYVSFLQACPSSGTSRSPITSTAWTKTLLWVSMPWLRSSRPSSASQDRTPSMWTSLILK